RVAAKVEPTTSITGESTAVFAQIYGTHVVFGIWPYPRPNLCRNRPGKRLIAKSAHDQRSLFENEPVHQQQPPLPQQQQQQVLSLSTAEEPQSAGHDENRESRIQQGVSEDGYGKYQMEVKGHPNENMRESGKKPFGNTNVNSEMEGLEVEVTAGSSQIRESAESSNLGKGKLVDISDNIAEVATVRIRTSGEFGKQSGQQEQQQLQYINDVTRKERKVKNTRIRPAPLEFKRHPNFAPRFLYVLLQQRPQYCLK
ncbi:hypothetical protein HDU76_002074, partial [Blyttiomyces sp. JEL0837]